MEYNKLFFISNYFTIDKQLMKFTGFRFFFKIHFTRIKFAYQTEFIIFELNNFDLKIKYYCTIGRFDHIFRILKIFKFAIALDQLRELIDKQNTAI
ncbi:hypothetical protein BpHYR1_046667 [Brachionus plicatilis]|uniref:Uncharacterized protein n=1 Tax=Brachionus plicatilis TaxID=10195 RepID=A0A3M7RVD0_BRAPC|nr:hypothetical protein BpHYR1_046667 [Brachionus plicatilis]